MSLPESAYYVGVDWGSAEHAVCVLTEAGRVHARFAITHTAAGFADLAHRLAKLGDAELVPVAIERPDGRLVDSLLEAGHPVVPVKSNAIKAWRDAEVLSGAKSDPGDAEVIAEYLRLRRGRLDAARPFSAHTRALRTIVRTRDDVVHLRVRATNMLASLLDVFWPGPGTCSRTSSRPSRWSSSPATRPRPRPLTWARSAWPPSAPSTATAAAARPLSWSSACAGHRPVSRTRSRPRPAVTPSSPWWPFCARSAA
ncbi:IS110 family transposase [Streptomyces malaysiensis]|uniref:IS110 family transposase n=1 Tax=Streptomyces malaysiensis TaxID=92644 RepID=UPI0019D30E84|nr:transposase [Streptomyces solisilvae]